MLKIKYLTAFLVVILWGVSFGNGLTGEIAPEITIRQWITKDAPDIRDLAGRVYILEFWATWCPGCVDSIDHLNEINNKYSGLGLELITLSEDRSIEKVRRFVQDKKINYHVAMDNGTADWFGVKSYPTLLVVGGRGRILWRGRPWDRGLEKAIEKALVQAGPPALRGIDMGPFDNLKKALFGGKDFAKAHRKIASHLKDNDETKTSVIARQIIEAIEGSISQRTSEADSLRAKDPQAAYNIYAEIAGKYYGIEAVEPAVTACAELKKFAGKKTPVIAAVGAGKPAD